MRLREGVSETPGENRSGGGLAVTLDQAVETLNTKTEGHCAVPRTAKFSIYFGLAACAFFF